MSAERVTYARLTTAGVTAIVSNRVWPIAVPQDKSRSDPDLLPYIVYARQSTDHERPLTGTGTQFQTVQVDYWCNTFTALIELGNAIELALDGQSGTIATVSVLGIFQRDRGDEETIDEETRSFHGTQIFEVII